MGAGLLRGARFILPAAAVAVGVALDGLYVLQLERYKPERYALWLRAHRGLLRPPLVAGSMAALAGLAVLLPALGAHWLVLLGLWLGGGYAVLARWRSIQVSQRLQFTPRAVRVAAVTAGLAALLLLVGLVVGPLVDEQTPLLTRLLAGAILGVSLCGLLAPDVVRVASRLVLPLERRINGRLLGEAETRMRSFPGRVLGITGSYGKTTTKFIAAKLLEAKYRVLKTPDGVNTTMGITRIIREELSNEDEVFVVECAAYGPGEIREVCDIIHPQLGILTAVGVQHLERFGTLERIAEAKYELLAALPRGGVAVVNADDALCLRLAERARAEGKRVLLYGLGAESPPLAVRGTDLSVSARGSSFRVVTAGGESARFDTRMVGRWNLSNILGGMAAALEWGVALEAMRPAVAALAPAPRRLEIREEGGIIKILDVANANPRGAEMALEVLGQFTGGRRILITPGMVELGSVEVEENRKFGQLAAAVCDYVVLVGPEQTRPIREGLVDRSFPPDRILTARQADEVADRLEGIVAPGDILLYENRLPDTYLEGRR